MDIREVTKDDQQSWADLWKHYLEFYETACPADVYQTTWARIMDPDEPMYAVMAFDTGRAVGLVNFLYHKSFWEVEDRVYLNDLYVDPFCRGAGIGGELIKSVENHAKEHNAALVYWLTDTDNKQAQILYDKVATRTPFIKYRMP